MKCPICSNESNYIFQSKILKKYDVSYYQCPNCCLVFTEEPYWLEEAYSDALTIYDTGAMVRCINNTYSVASIIDVLFKRKQGIRFLDYGGGYGVFSRMMRDLGYDFYWYDKYAKPLLINGFEWDGESVSAMTLFEVFEHYNAPVEEIKQLFKISDTLILTTELYDKDNLWKTPDWWYYSQEGGQHIMFYSDKTFEYLADFFDCNYYNLGGIIVLTKLKISTFKLFWLKSKLVRMYFKFKTSLSLDYFYSIKDMEYLKKNEKQL